MLAQPFGQIIIALAGLVIGIIGVVFFIRAVSFKFKKSLKKNEMNKKEWKWSGYIGTFGIGARGIVFMIIAFFLIRTAWQADPNETKGLDGALSRTCHKTIWSHFAGHRFTRIYGIRRIHVCKRPIQAIKQLKPLTR